MRFAIQHAVGDPRWSPAVLRPDAIREFAVAVEAGGYDAIAFTDHPAPSSRWVDTGGEGAVDPFTALGFCAGVTSRIRLLTFVLVAAYRNPFLAAHQLASLDALSGGRLTVGLGTGYLFSEFHALGARPADRLVAFDDAVSLMIEAWRGVPVEAQRDGFSARDAMVLPPVVQQPHPPLWIHGNSRWGLERAATRGQGWLGTLTGDDEVLPRTMRTAPLPDLAALRVRIAELRAATERAGRDPAAVDIVVSGLWPMLDVRSGWSAERRLEEAATLTDLGVGWMVLTCCGDDAGAALETVRRFGQEVVSR